MAGAVPSGSFRISPVDRLGRRIDPAVLAAAEEISLAAVAYGMKLLGDLAVIANLLEEAAATVSRRLQSQSSRTAAQQIQNLPAFLLVCFRRKVHRAKRKQVVTVSMREVARSKPSWADPAAEFDMKILIDEFLTRCDFITQDMVWRRLQGYSWKEIGGAHGMSAHAAEERCSHVFQQVREKLKI
jgi:DNA-directed RNA polymerase specialized sigma24 family protein